MTEQKFDEINDHFNQLMSENDLLDVMNVIDNERKGITNFKDL